MKTLEVLERVLRGKRVRPATQYLYRRVLESLAEYSEDWPDNGAVVNEWINTLDGFSDTTVRMWFSFVVASGKYIQKIMGRNPDGSWKVKNPCDDADRPKVSKKRRRYFSPDEMMRVLGACRFGYDRELILTLIDSTCRVGELAGLVGGKVGEGFIVVVGKTGERKYRLDIKICGALKALAGSDGGVVFKDAEGRALNERGLASRARRIIVRAGMTGSKLGAHTLRHSGASLVARETGSALAVKALLQHDNIDTSMIYIHDVEDEIQQRVSPLQLLGEKVFGDRVGQVKMITDGSEATAVLPAEGERGGMAGLAEDMFPEVEVGKEVRPLLKNEDLVLIREAFVVFCEYGENKDGMFRARELMKRMLRRSR